MYEKTISVLYLDDEVENLVAFKANFRREYNVYTAQTVEKALEIIDVLEIHVVVSDQKMPQMTGIEFLESLRHSHPHIVRVLLSGCADLKTVVDAVNRGQIFRYLYKPMDAEDVRKTIQYAYEMYEQNMEGEENLKQLLETNEKLEFMLRQSLIS